MLRQLAVFCFLCGLVFHTPTAFAGTGQEIPYAEHDCIVYVPKQAMSGERTPVLVCLPGRGVGAAKDIKRWEEAAGSTGLFLMDFNVDYLSIENDLGVRQLQFRIESMLKLAARSYSVQTQKLYVAGTSAGAVTALALILRYPEKYESAGLVSTGPLNFETENYALNASSKRFYIAHGEQDEVVPVEGVLEVRKFLERNNAVVKFVSVPGGKHDLPPNVYRSLLRWIFPPRDFLQKLKSFF